MTKNRIGIVNLARSELRGQNFVTFDVAMNGRVISTVDAPVLSGRIVWSHAAFNGFSDFNPGEKVALEAEVDRALSPPAPSVQASSWRHH